MAAVGVFIVIVLLAMRRPWEALTVTLAILLSDAVTGLLKVGFGRPRPSDSLADVGATAFPSGHTAIAATVAIVLALLIRRRIAWVIAISWVLVMAWSRTYLAAHWLNDVAGGAILGTSAALLGWWAVVTIRLAIDRHRMRQRRGPAGAERQPGVARH